MRRIQRQIKSLSATASVNCSINQEGSLFVATFLSLGVTPQGFPKTRLLPSGPRAAYNPMRLQTLGQDSYTVLQVNRMCRTLFP
jgi:hypothetical protein